MGAAPHADPAQAAGPPHRIALVETMPAALAPLVDERRWLVWRWEWVEPKGNKPGRWTKVCYQAGAPARHAKSNDPATWGEYGEARAAVAAGQAHGIGFALSGSGYGSFDLDDCRDPGTGELEEWALTLVERAGTYAEATVSGTGGRIIGRATGPKVHRKQRVPGVEAGSIETYRSCERYIVVTGAALPDSGALTNIDEEIDRTVAWLDEEKQAKQKRRENVPPDSGDQGRRTDLPPALERLIRFGPPAGDDRSAAFMHAVGWLKDYGWDVPAIVALFERHPGGIAEKYVDRLEGEVQRCFDKAQTKARKDRRGRSSRSDGSPEAGTGRDASIDEVVTEDAAAQRYAELHAGRLRYCHSTGAWFEWTGAAWRQNGTGLAFQWARELARELSRPFEDEPKVKAVLGKTAFAAGVERFARSDPAFAVTHDAWDSDLWLLGTPGGTVDLRTGQLREPDPADGITKLTAVAPAAVAHCPTWLAFLDEATKGDPQMVRLIRQLAGYALTGDVREEILPFAFGGGGNGKGVTINTMRAIMGDYAVTATMDTFMASHGDKHSTDLAMLRGARLVTASETEEGRAWAESRIKQMTGRDPITARFMRRDNFTYLPQFLLFIMGNNKPNLTNVDDAMRRRFIILPFQNKPAVVDPFLPEKLKGEWPGILRWMIEGCLDWQQNGLVRSERDRAATDEYFATQDAFGQWLSEDCDVEPGNEYKTATSTELFSSWQAYAKRTGEEAGTQKAFSGRMEKRGFVRCRTETARGYRGLRLRPHTRWQEAAE